MDGEVVVAYKVVHGLQAGTVISGPALMVCANNVVEENNPVNNNKPNKLKIRIISMSVQSFQDA